MKKLSIITFALALLMVGCGGDTPANETKKAAAKTNENTISEDQIKYGIGPISSLDLAPLDSKLAKTGEDVFALKCIACHKFDSRLVGPPLNGVTSRRTPEFIMNMILNPEEMVKKHPEVKEMLATYYVPMTFQNVSEDDARAILEYLRSQDSLEESN